MHTYLVLNYFDSHAIIFFIIVINYVRIFYNLFTRYRLMSLFYKNVRVDRTQYIGANDTCT